MQMLVLCSGECAVLSLVYPSSKKTPLCSVMRCCEKYDLDESCRELCKRNNTVADVRLLSFLSPHVVLSIVQFINPSNARCKSGLSILNYCAGEGVDVSDCCVANGIARGSNCLQMCNSAKVFFDTLSKMVTFSRSCRHSITLLSSTISPIPTPARYLTHVLRPACVPNLLSID